MTKMFSTEIVHGTCPTCDQKTLLVGIANSYYRCSACGVDLEQQVNGVRNCLGFVVGRFRHLSRMFEPFVHPKHLIHSVNP